MTRTLLTLTFVIVCSMLVGCQQRPKVDTQSSVDLTRGLELYEQRKFAEALPLLKKAHPGSLDESSKSHVLTTIGNCYYELDQREESLKYHDQAIDINPGNHQAYVNKGVVYRLMGEYEEAKKQYEKALEMEPNYAELHASMGALAVYQSDYEEAVKHLERAIELDDTLAVSHSNLAVAYAMVGRFDDSDKELNRAVIRGYHQPNLIREQLERIRDASETGE